MGFFFWSEIKNGKAIKIDIGSTGCHGKANEVNYLEHIQVFVTIEYSRRGDLHLNLTSPNGKFELLKNLL